MSPRVSPEIEWRRLLAATDRMPAPLRRQYRHGLADLLRSLRAQIAPERRPLPRRPRTHTTRRSPR